MLPIHSNGGRNSGRSSGVGSSSGRKASSRHSKRAKVQFRLCACIAIFVFIFLLGWEVSVITKGSVKSSKDYGDVPLTTGPGQPLVGTTGKEYPFIGSQGAMASLRAQLQLAESAKEELERQLREERARGDMGSGASTTSDSTDAIQGEVNRLRAELSAVTASATSSASEVKHLQEEISRLVSEESLNTQKLSASEHERQSLAAELQLEKALIPASSPISLSNSPDSISRATTKQWYSEKPGRLLSPYSFHYPLPPLIDAWRNGKIDWHDLIPAHSSLWERYGESKDDKFNFMKLVMKEIAVTDYLTQYQDSGLASNFGHDFGPMRNYSGCNLLDDPCQIHSMNDCSLDSFCHWDHATTSCITATEEQSHQSCPSGRKPIKIVNGRLQSADGHECKRYIHEKVFVEHVQDDPATMFYHWWRYFKEVYSRAKAQSSLNKVSHYLIDHPPNTQFFHYFGLLSRNCWRRSTSLPPKTCFCDGSGTGSRHSGEGDVLDHLLRELQLDHIREPSRVRVSILSRRRKRFILNEHELVSAVLDMGYDVQILPMEEMTLYEQIKALRETTILVGIHGSGLNNAILLPTDAVLVQLLPYKLNYKGAFQQVARENGVHYIEWGLEDPDRSFFHWEFLGKRELAGGKQAVLDRGSPRGGAEVYTFWINQDIRVPVDEFKELITRAVTRMGKLNPRLAGLRTEQ